MSETTLTLKLPSTVAREWERVLRQHAHETPTLRDTHEELQKLMEYWHVAPLR